MRQSHRSESNGRPLAYEANALPTELRRRMEPAGIEPATFPQAAPLGAATISTVRPQRDRSERSTTELRFRLNPFSVRAPIAELIRSVAGGGES